jgi:hypothetical protein
MDGEPIKPRPARRTRRMSGCRCILLLFGLGALALAAFVSYYAAQFGRVVWREMRMPFFEHRTDAPGAVRPLISQDTRFDVALVVWVRTPDALTSHPERYAPGYEEPDPAGQFIQRKFGIPGGEIHVPEYEAVFSDTVMRGVTLRDRTTTANVSFELPLARL